jgi:predicted transglutaminase-like cysteine proteinase
LQRILGPILAAAAALATISPAYASPAAPRMPLGRVTAPPVGYMDFCARRPAECREQAGRPPAAALSVFWRDAFNRDSTAALADARTADAEAAVGPLALTAPVLDLLNAVNRDVNRAIAPRNDLGPTDLWTLPLADGSAAGDCEDYVLEKRRALAAAGLPPEALSIAVVRTRSGETHAVLVVDTDAGELVLDNRSQWIAPWSSLDYRWVKRQSRSDPASWVRVGAL